MKIPRLSILLLMIGYLAIGCAYETEIKTTAVKKVSIEKQYCDFCQQEIRSQRFGGGIKGSDGNEYKFRSIECLAGFYINQGVQSTDEVSLINFIDAKSFLTVNEAIFLVSPNLGSPNGMNFAALDRTNSDMLEKIERAYPGDFIEWEDVVARVNQSGYASKY